MEPVVKRRAEELGGGGWWAGVGGEELSRGLVGKCEEPLEWWN